jgi:hypothetical protein
MEKVGLPSVTTIKESMLDFACGLGGGIIYALSAGFMGSGLIGGLIGAGLAGSVIKGVRGTAIATILGFQTIVGAATAPASADENRSTVM